jgi:DNA-directed RNA polymerase specialized sigma24 family protein
MAWADQVDAAWAAEQVGRWDGPRLEALRRCEEQLVGRRAAAVRMFYAEQRSRREIAAALGMKETGVKTLLQRVRQDLRQCIEEQTS